MWTSHPKSLKNLLLIHEIAFLVLVSVTGILGGLSAYFWQQYSAESVRINNLINGTEHMRSELFRQIQEAIRARLLEDPQALEQYGEYSRRIDKQFTFLRENAVDEEEMGAIEDLQVSYREIQRDMNKIFTDPYLISRQVRMRILDPTFAQRMVGKFEGEYQAMNRLLSEKHDALEEWLNRWISYAPIIIALPLLLAVLLVLFARHILQREFVHPMARVLDGAHIISSGRLDHTIPAGGVKEVSELAETINTMAGEVEASREALVENERQAALGALVPVVAHNIRNPLASIRATAQVLDEVDDPEELKEFRQAILDTIDRLGRWVNALVSYLHPLKPNYRLVHASKMLDAALSLLKPKLEQKRMQVAREGWENDLRLNADPDLMEQAVYALMANAVDASPTGSQLTIALEKKENTLEIHIHDEGPGLPFDPEPHRLTPGPSTKRLGTGLGIPIAFKICQHHGWELRFKVKEGEGTDAVITAPIRVVEDISE